MPPSTSAEASLEWANRVRKERPDTPPEAIAEEVRLQTAQVARIDGAVSGTPFLIALVPGYLAYLWQEGHMERRMAALYGHDPRELETGAQILVLRGVHPTIEAARAALVKVRDTELPEKPTTRRPLRVWVRSVWTLLIFGGFVTASSDDQRDKYAHWRLKATLGFIGATLIWVITWVLPVSFMIAMAWACESHARSLGRRTMRFYSGESTDIDAAIAAADEEERRGAHQARFDARRATRALGGDSGGVHRLRGPRPPDHRRQLGGRSRRGRRCVARPRYFHQSQPRLIISSAGPPHP